MTVRDPNNNPISGVLVTALLGDDERISATATSNAQGQAVLAQTPTSSALIIQAMKTGYRDRQMSLAGTQTTLTLQMDRANNDLSQDLQGWTNSAGSNAFTAEHSEAFPGWVNCPDCVGRNSIQAATQAGTPRPTGPDLASASTPSRRDNVVASGSDFDITLTSKNALPAQTVMRRFRATRGAAQVTIRYRFATAEPQSPNPQNDAFFVRLANLDSGAVTADSQTVFSLSGAGQLDSQGATGWRTLSVSVQDDHLVELTMTVDNVGDAAYVSLIFGDIITEQGVLITDLKLYDNRMPPSSQVVYQDLKFLSVSHHSAYGGKTRVNGTLHVHGVSTDSLKEVKLEVLEAGVVKASALLVSMSPTILGVQFGTNGVAITSPQLLFELSASDLAQSINQTVDGTLLLRVKVTTTQGRTDTKDWTPLVQKLIWYAGSNRRATNRELNTCLVRSGSAWSNFPCGGDSWALPSAAAASSGVSDVVFNDFSNMNGGLFPDHSSHQNGNDVDVFFGTAASSTFAVTGANAQRLIALLNSAAGNQIDFLYVTYSAGSEFWDGIKNAVLNDGTRVIPVTVRDNVDAGGNRNRLEGRIRNWNDHLDHFHIRWRQ